MDIHKATDCAVGCSATVWGWVAGQPWYSIIGAAILIWTAIRAFILEPLGVPYPPKWGWWRRWRK